MVSVVDQSLRPMYSDVPSMVSPRRAATHVGSRLVHLIAFSYTSLFGNMWEKSDGIYRDRKLRLPNYI